MSEEISAFSQRVDLLSSQSALRQVPLQASGPPSSYTLVTEAAPAAPPGDSRSESVVS